MTGGTSYEDRQRAFARRVRAADDLEHGTIIVLPSLTLAYAELRKITAIQRYEERLLCFALLAARAGTTVVYVTSLPIDPAVIDYHLDLLGGGDDACRRLIVIAQGDDDPAPLSEKLLRGGDALDRIAAAVTGQDAYLLPFNVTPLELEVADRLGVPVFGPSPHLVPLGSKSGSRSMAAKAGVRTPDGAEDVRTVADLDREVRHLLTRRPDLHGIVVKLNNSFSGQGNALLAAGDIRFPLRQSVTLFCADEESWPTFSAKMAAEGAIVEELLRPAGLVSPSAQLRVLPSGEAEIVSTHDQMLGGPGGQVYLGCRFPADEAYRGDIQAAGLAVGRALAAEGVIGFFGIDFLVWPEGSGHQVRLSEINLRLGGTTHPFWMARLLTGGRLDAATGQLMAGGQPVCYEATDNLKSEGLVGQQPAELIDRLRRAGLLFDRGSGEGVTLHLLGALAEYGKLGATCIAQDRATADRLFVELRQSLGIAGR